MALENERQASSVAGYRLERWEPELGGPYGMHGSQTLGDVED